MKYRKSIVTVSLVALIVCAVAVPVLAAEDEAMPNGPLGMRGLLRTTVKQVITRLRAVRDELNLTAEQKQSIGQILQGHRDEIVDVIKGVHEGRESLRDAVRKDTVDEQAIRRAARSLSGKIGDAAVLRAKVRAEVREVLTDDQRAVADKAADDVDKIIADAIASLGK